MKVIQEKISGNLTTSQYLEIYDTFLLNSIKPLIENTRYFDSFVIRLIGWQEKNFRRKVSFKPRPEFPRLATLFLLARDSCERLAAYKAMKLDRGARIEFLKTFHESMEVYEKACNCELTPPNPNQDVLSYCLGVKSQIEKGHKSDATLVEVISESKLWLGRALTFKQSILEKYVRLCLNTAQKDYVHYFHHRIPLDDIVQTYLMAASRAIDKCDLTQGALTSHIQNWLFSGRDHVSKHSQDPKVESYVEHLEDLVDLTADNEVERLDSERNDELELRRLAKLCDPSGVGRAYLGIPEILCDRETLKFFESK